MRTYDKKDLGIKSLIGKEIMEVKINSAKDLVVLVTKTGPLYLSWSGDCCAHCFIANVSGSHNLVGATILEADDTEWTEPMPLNPDDKYGDVFNTMGTKLKTSKGYVDFESRVEHNGYYGGTVKVSEEGKIDQYSCLDTDWDGKDLKPLEDF